MNDITINDPGYAAIAAETYGRVTGSVRSTVIVERVRLDGSRVIEQAAVWERVNNTVAVNKVSYIRTEMA